ncbi:MAG: efflux RND transporter periplasmic adaptor subunit [Chlamydiota bacterium]|nr:efflux RND transporter periplasmic adaptor subunit [Chlamydiota bacterium]
MIGKIKIISLVLFFVLLTILLYVFFPTTATHDHELEESHAGEKNQLHSEDKGHKEQSVHLSNEEIKEFEIETALAKPGKLKVYLNLSGEVSFNENRLAHIVPRVPGVVRDVYKNFGDEVKEKCLLAVIESRDLADLKADFLGSLEKVRLTQAKYEREKGLWEKKITSEQDYLDSKQAYEEERIKLSSSEQKLHAIGLDDEALKDLRSGKEHVLTNYEMRSPINGIVVEKHLTLGEKIDNDTNAFTIADFSDVWVNLIIYQKDLGKIHVGQEALITSKAQDPSAFSKIDYVSSFLDESTRTATARIVLDNQLQHWKPGMFITAKVAIEETEVPVMVSRSAIQLIEGKNIVFVKEGEEFHAVPIEIGRSDIENIEIISGLSEGEEYVKKNSFTLKAELGKESFGDGHGH